MHVIPTYPSDREPCLATRVLETLSHTDMNTHVPTASNSRITRVLLFTTSLETTGRAHFSHDLESIRVYADDLWHMFIELCHTDMIMDITNALATRSLSTLDPNLKFAGPWMR